MSVLMTLRVKGDVQELERRAAGNPERMNSIIEVAKRHGVIAHRFYGTDDGQIMVLDEWPDAESFQAFFAETQDLVGPMMAEVGVTAEPEVVFWHELDTNDKIGWGA